MLNEQEGRSSNLPYAGMSPPIIVLVANSSVGKEVSDILRANGHAAHILDNPFESLAYVDAHPPALILLQSELPEVSGLEICRRLRHRRKTRHVPVLVITRNAEEEIRALQAGASDFFSVPLRSEEVLSRVRTQLERGRNADERAAPARPDQGRAHLLPLIRKLPIAVAIVDEAGRVECINERFTENFGYDIGDISCIDVWWQRACPGECNRSFETAGPPAENIPPREYSIVAKDGTAHLVNVFGSVLGNRKLVLFDDITERKQAEVALRESEERFRVMADSAPVMLWVADTSRQCIFFNRGWLTFTGRSMEEEMGDGWANGVHPDDLPHCLAVYSTAFDARETFQMEYRLRRSDGEYRWILDNGAPRFAADGVFTGYVGSAVDVTELRHNQQQMLAAQKLESLGVLAGGIAHDFHNFLGCILADAAVTMSEVEMDSPARDGLERIETVALRAAQIVRQITDYTGHQQSGMGPVDLAPLVREMVELLRVCVPKGARINVNLPQALGLARGNATQLRQAVMNLIINAGEALGDHGGSITITGEYQSAHRRNADRANSHPGTGYVSIEISDTGAGMTEEVQRRIFDPLFSTKGNGRGLGLAAIQAIVRNHQGTIEVSSTPGEGTSFHIVLPAGALSSAPMSGAGFSRGSRSVLIVEDEESLRISVARMLRKQGFSVLEAANGNRAVELIRDRANDIAVVLLDITLPGMSCAEVFGQLRRIRPAVKVILTSAYAPESVTASLRAFEPETFIRKPYRFSELVTVVCQALPRESLPPGKAAELR